MGLTLPVLPNVQIGLPKVNNPKESDHSFEEHACLSQLLLLVNKQELNPTSK